MSFTKLFKNPYDHELNFMWLSIHQPPKTVTLEKSGEVTVGINDLMIAVVDHPSDFHKLAPIPTVVYAINVGHNAMVVVDDRGNEHTLLARQALTLNGQVITFTFSANDPRVSVCLTKDSYHHRQGVPQDDKPSVVFGPLDTEGLMRGVTSFELMRDLKLLVPDFARPFDALQLLKLVVSKELQNHFSGDIQRSLIQLLEMKHVYGFDENRRLIKSDLTGQANCALGLDDLKFFIRHMEHALWVQLDFDHFERELNKLTVDQADFAIQAFAETNPMSTFNHEAWVNTFNTFSAEMYLKGGTEWLNVCLAECVRKPFKPSIQQNQLWTPNFQPQFAPQPMQMPLDQSRMYQPPSHNMPPQHPMPGAFPPPGMPFGQIQHPHFPMGHNLNTHRPQF